MHVTIELANPDRLVAVFGLKGYGCHTDPNGSAANMALELWPPEESPWGRRHDLTGIAVPGRPVSSSDALTKTAGSHRNSVAQAPGYDLDLISEYLWGNAGDRLSDVVINPVDTYPRLQSDFATVLSSNDGQAPPIDPLIIRPNTPPSAIDRVFALDPKDETQSADI